MISNGVHCPAGLTIEPEMRMWTYQAGYPLVTLDFKGAEANGVLVVRQVPPLP